MKNIFLSFVFLSFCFSLNAQNIPITQLYLFQLTTKDSKTILTQPKYLSKYNPDGYNNQPAFFRENELYVTVQTSGSAQTDIYKLDDNKSELTRITKTKESEYSPTVMPDNRHFSVVRVDADDQKTQRLWKYPLDRSNGGSVLLPEITGVGYHYWVNQNEVLLFIVGDQNKLILADIRTGITKHVATNPGRCFKKLPNGNVAITHKSSVDTWFVKEYDIQTNSLRTIVSTLKGSEDFVVLGDGSYIMGKGSRLYRYDSGTSSDWQLMTDLNHLGIQQITRMTLSRGGRLALVGQ